MRSLGEIRKSKRLFIEKLGEDGGLAHVRFPCSKEYAFVVFSWGGGWDHVSVSFPIRCCTWEEMCYIKDVFWHEDECVVQYHPAKEDYVNRHPYCLHLWKPQGQEISKPPKWMVG